MHKGSRSSLPDSTPNQVTYQAALMRKAVGFAVMHHDSHQRFCRGMCLKDLLKILIQSTLPHCCGSFRKVYLSSSSCFHTRLMLALANCYEYPSLILCIILNSVLQIIFLMLISQSLETRSFFGHIHIDVSSTSLHGPVPYLDKNQMNSRVLPQPQPSQQTFLSKGKKSRLQIGIKP